MALELASDERVAQVSQDALRNPKTEPEIIAALGNDVSSAEWILAAMHRQWYEQTLWTLGEQNLEWNPATRRFQAKPAAEHVPRSVTNLILPKVEIGINLFMESLPKAKYTPTTKEDKDRAAAEVAQGVMRYRDDEGHIEEKKRELGAWVVVCGTGYMLAQEDKSTYEMVRRPVFKRGVEPVVDKAGVPIPGPDGLPMTKETEEPVMNPETGEQEFDEFLMTDESVEVVSPFEIIPDLSARYPWEWRRYTHFRARSRDWIGNAYGSAAKSKVKAQRESGILGDYQLKMLDIQSRSANAGRVGLSVGASEMAAYRYLDDSVTVISRYEIPSRDYPKGRMLTIAGGIVLDSGTYPYGDDLNLYCFRWSVLPGSPWGFGMPRNLIPLQRRLNGIDTTDDLIRKTMGNPAWLAPKRSQFSVSTATGKPGAVYQYRPVGGAAAPQRLDPKGPHPYNQAQRANITEGMQEISGARDVLAGNPPQGITAGVSLELLVEQAGNRFQPQTKANRETWKRLYMHRVEIAQKANAWQRGRAIPLIGEDGSRDVKHFMAADFTGSMTVEVEAVPITAMSQVLRRQNFVNGLKVGLVDVMNSAQNRERGRSLFGLLEFDEPFSLDYKRASMENELLMAGNHVAVGPADDDETHMNVHARMIKSREWDDMPFATQASILKHFDEHVLRLAPTPGAEDPNAEVGPDGKPKDTGKPQGPGTPAGEGGGQEGEGSMPPAGGVA